MSASELRQSFLDFFAQRGHTVLPSSSLVPAGDATLLFANAGMNQFKDVFTGQVTRAYQRAATSQKCVRAGGKHNDLENVGHTPRHHTFFEMLGNFSFGDYFKEGAIAYAWEYLTRVLALDSARLWITIHESDGAAGELWQRVAGVPAARIVRLGDKDNFWAMGETGPCGPCSEIHFDQGRGAGCGRPECDLTCGCGRFLEIWNLVFMQYEQKADGTRHPLPKPSIDTGMGLERLAAVVGGLGSNYDSDLFSPLTLRVAELCGKAYDTGAGGAGHRVLADHAKAAAFLVTEGVLPSNEGRGYVLRRIMRRALRHAYLLGLRQPLLSELHSVVASIYGRAYPELAAKGEPTRAILREEEERFLTTIEQGLQLFEKRKAGWKKAGVVPGLEAFTLYDTYGFPLDLTEVMAAGENLRVDGAGFEAAMLEQRANSRASSMFKAGALEGLRWTVLAEASQTFAGYSALACNARLLRCARTREGQLAIVPEVTVFYAESGGQVGDVGTLSYAGHTARVVDTQLADGWRVLVLEPGFDFAPPGPVEGQQQVDGELRRRTAANHTCTHLLHKALREVLGERAEQRGSWVGPTHLRFDFPHGKPVSGDELAAIEQRVNAWIRADLPVATRQTSFEKAAAEGVTALFGEKYGDEVRVVDIKDCSRELCGGTHLARSGEALAFLIRSEGSIASGVRRIEALTGPGALDHLMRSRDLLQRAAAGLQARPEELPERLEHLRAEHLALQKKAEAFAMEGVLARLAGPLAAPAQAGDLRYVAEIVAGAEAAALRAASERVRAQHPGLVLLLAGVSGDKAALAVTIPETIAKAKNLNAGKLVKELAALTGGGGGGSPTFAQAGGADPARLEDALATFKKLLTGLPAR